MLVSLPPAYPESAPPQLQLLARYVGPFGVDAPLFGSVLRTFISKDGVEWAPGAVCVFDGLQSVAERCGRWYEERPSTDAAGRMVREDERDEQRPPAGVVEMEGRHTAWSADATVSLPPEMPENVQIVEAEAITDRKSAFVGRACRISDPSQVRKASSVVSQGIHSVGIQVPLVLAHLISDRRIARAAHPIINAWRCEVGGTLHQDNDDDGETAAGGRLAHLLQILVRFAHTEHPPKPRLMTVFAGREQRASRCHTIFRRYPSRPRQIQAHQPGRTERARAGRVSRRARAGRRR